MTKALVFALFAAAGVGVAVLLTLVHDRYLGGETDNGALIHVWLSAALWIVAWTGAAYAVLRSGRR